MEERDNNQSITKRPSDFLRSLRDSMQGPESSTDELRNKEAIYRRQKLKLFMIDAEGKLYQTNPRIFPQDLSDDGDLL